MTGWQPIETAPKDGTSVLVFWSSDACMAVMWKELDRDGKYAWFGVVERQPDDDLPTHWMPLPPPP